MGNMHTIDLVVLVLYFAAMAAMGPLFARRNRTTEGYFLGDRSFPGWLTGISMFATSISSITFVAYPGDAFKTSWLRMLPNFMLPIGIVVAVTIFLPFFRKTQITSAFEYLEGRFGAGTRLYAASAFIVSQVIRVSLILYLVSLLVYEITGLDKYLCILIGGMITAFYSILGGIRAVLWTDFIQAMVLWAGGLLCVGIIAFSVPGGLGGIISTAWEDGRIQFAEYMQDGQERMPLAEAPAGAGRAVVKLPADLRPGDEYMVRVSAESGVSDDSNVNFTVGPEAPDPSLTLLTGKWGPVWVRGEDVALRWRSDGEGAVRIGVRRDGGMVRTLAASVPDAGEWTWSIPADLPPGDDYRVVIQESDTGALDESAVYVVIAEEVPDSLLVRSPNGGELWPPDSTQEVTWHAGGLGADETVRVELVRGRGLRPASFAFSLTEKTIWVMLLLGLVAWLTEYSSNQNVVQRYAASKSPKEARRASWVCCWFSVPTWGLFMFLGTCLYVYFKTFPDPKAAAVFHGIHNAKAEEILPYFVIQNLPVGISGLVIAGVLAAAMSSISSSISSVSAVGIVDIYRRHLVKERDDKHYVFVAKSIGLGLAVIMILGASLLMSVQTKTLQDTATVLGALTGGGLLGLYLLGFLTRVGDGRAIGVGIAATLLFTAWMALTRLGWLPEGLQSSIDSYWAGILGHIIMFGLGYVLGLVLPKRKRDLTNLTVWDMDDKPLV